MLILQLVDYNDAQYFERLPEVRRTGADLRIVLLAWLIKELTFLTHTYEVGVDAYLESTTSQEGFRQSLDHMVTGERIFSTRLKEPTVTAADRKISEKSPVPSSLSVHELGILPHLASGQANKVIANDLHFTEATAKVHVKNPCKRSPEKDRRDSA